MENYPEIYNINFNKDELRVNESIRKIKINHIRKMFLNIIEKPVMGKYKIFNIKYAENMNINAQNALLKILEEPPKYSIILLSAKNIDSLLPTIKSRCTKIYIFESENDFCKILKEDFEGKNNTFNLLYKEILILKKYEFYNKYKELFTRQNYKENIRFLEEGLYCFLNDKNNKYFKLYEIFLEVNKRIEGNCNFEMLIDFFLFKSWDIMNI